MPLKAEPNAELNEPKTEAPRTIEAKRERNPLKRAIKILGPGLITGASDDDPSGIATYSTVGAQFGYSALWMAPLTFPLMMCIQYVCSKIGLVTGRGLAGVLRKNYSGAVVWSAILILVVANVINAGTDIGAMAAGVHLLLPQVPEKVAIIPITLVMLFSIILFSYKKLANILKWLTLSLFAYIVTAFFCQVDWQVAMRDTLIPNFSWQPGYIAAIVALLGTTISPYLFFWQASNEVDEQKDAGARSVEDRKGASRADLKYAAMDVGAGMFFSNAVMYFIILTCAATLFRNNQNNIESASQAAKALEPLVGPAAKYLFAAGFIGTGFLAVPILIGSACYAVSEALDWKCGFGEKCERARGFYWMVGISTIVAMLLNFLHINSMQALYWTAILNGVLAPPLLALIMLVSNDPKVMGTYTNSKLVNAVGWITFALMTIAVGLLAWTAVSGQK